MKRVASLTLACAVLAGCADHTALKIIVTSPDLLVPADVDRLQIQVVGDVTGMMSTDQFALASPWPQSLSVRPGRSHSEGLVITVTGRKSTGPADMTGAFVVRRVVHGMFIRDEDHTITVVLSRDCRGVMCADGVDCVAGRCAMAGDGGMPDAGREAGTDAGPDLGPDLGPIDAGCFTALACNDGVACTVDTCVSGGCVNTPMDSRCTLGDLCDPVRGCGGRPCTSDAVCSDGNTCNGTETCDLTAMVCRTGMSPTCDDGDACTDGMCVGTTPGACAFTTHDGDGDGHGPTTCASIAGFPVDDCNDANAMVFPGQAESCNGVDDNCDGACDNGFACCRGTIGSCTTACGTTGMRACDASCALGACTPPPEVCNGMDDDCNGMCDDGVGCCAGSVSTCTTSCRTTGTVTCSATCVPSACVPPAEICDGVDNNCDAVVDEGFACVAGSTVPCTASCGTVGTQSCGATCALGACVPPAEVCNNGVDDDCNGATDCLDASCAGAPSCSGCSACAGATPVASPGGRFSVMLHPGSNVGPGACAAATGSETTLSFVLAAASDVFITTHGAGIDTLLYVRSCTCSGPDVAGGCNDDADGMTTSALHLTSLAAGEYNVFVDTKAAMSATINVDVYISTPGMPSDRCGNPTFVAAGTTTIAGTTCGYDADYVPDLGGGCLYSGAGQERDRVYYFYLPTARVVTLDGCAGNVFDSTLFLRSTCSDAATTAQVFCQDDGCAGGGATCDRPRFHTRISQTIGPGLFYLFSDGYFYGPPGLPACPGCGTYSYVVTGL